MGPMFGGNSVGQFCFKCVDDSLRLLSKLFTFRRQLQPQRATVTGQPAHEPARFKPCGDRSHIGALNIKHPPKRTLGYTWIFCHNLKNSGFCCAQAEHHNPRRKLRHGST